MNLAGRRVEQVGAAHDIADVLLGVVDHHCELVGEQAVGAVEDEVADVPLEHLLMPTLHAIDEADRIAGRTYAQGTRGARRRAATGARIYMRAVGGEAE